MTVRQLLFEKSEARLEEEKRTFLGFEGNVSDAHSTIHYFLIVFGGEFKEQLSQHLTWLQDRPGLRSTEADSLINRYGENDSTNEKLFSLMKTIIYTACNHYENEEDLATAIENISQTIYSSALKTPTTDLFFENPDVLTREYVWRFLFSYALKTLTMEAILELAVAVSKSFSEKEPITSVGFLKLAEIHKNPELREYPIEWIVQLTDVSAESKQNYEWEEL